MGVKAQPVCNTSLSLSLTRARTVICSQDDLPASDAQKDGPEQDRSGGILLSLEPASDTFVFVGCSLTKCLKWANESCAYLAKLVLDGAESAQMFYDIPVMRFHIDPTTPSRTTGSSLFSILTHAVRSRLPFIWIVSLVFQGL